MFFGVLASNSKSHCTVVQQEVKVGCDFMTLGYGKQATFLKNTQEAYTEWQTKIKLGFQIPTENKRPVFFTV